MSTPNQSFPMADNPMQPAVDAELAKFDAEWFAANPRALLPADEKFRRKWTANLLPAKRSL